MRLKILKTALCVQPTSSKFLMLKSILYAIHVFLNIVEIFSLLQSNNTCLMFSLTTFKVGCLGNIYSFGKKRFKGVQAGIMNVQRHLIVAVSYTNVMTRFSEFLKRMQ